MSEFLYSGWFENNKAEDNDEDKQWVACFQIISEKIELAREWGDFLSSNYSKRNPDERFISSIVEPSENYNESDLSKLPTVRYGEIVDDNFIGW